MSDSAGPLVRLVLVELEFQRDMALTALENVKRLSKRQMAMS